MLHQRITNDLKEVLKSGNSFVAGTLRMILSSLHNREIEKRGKGLEETLSEEEIIEVLFKEAKKRKEAIEAFTKGNRDDLVQKETKELKIIENYLPQLLSEAEIEKIVNEVIEKMGTAEIKNFGRVMGETMKELKGKADASAVSEIVKNKLKI